MISFFESEICKYWLGKQVEIDYLSGRGCVEVTNDLYAYDGKIIYLRLNAGILNRV